MQERERFIRLCVKGMESLGLINDARYKERFKKELKEIDAQGEHEYYLNLYDKFHEENLIFPKNENNSLVDYLLNLAPEFKLEEHYGCITGECPDIDIDYLSPVRDKLKRVWAPQAFGQEYICEIGTYGTLGIKQAIKDMAKIHGLPKDEIEDITRQIKDKYKDENGETRDIEWDDAITLYPDFKAYCERHPEVAKAAQLLISRNKSGGVHAGGLIISNILLENFVPLEVRMVNKENPNGVICCAWTEGLNRQDLGPVGLIKFDLLVINNLMQIAYACNLIKKRHGLDSICALPGQWDWSDISYLNDPKALAMANSGDLTCIFQFDSPGIQKLVKRGGVTCFDDLAAYSALYRPGPLNMGMDARYCKRKRGEEPYNVHPVLQASLGATYGVMIYQEQVMDLLRLVGLVPDMHTEKVRKAISKKKVAQFIKYKEMVIENGQKVLNVNRDYVEDLWRQIESFAAYGFNKSMTIDTLICSYNNGSIEQKKIQDFIPGGKVLSVDSSGNTVVSEVVQVHDHGELEAFEVMFDDGYKVTCSINHKFLTEHGQKSLREIIGNNYSILCDPEITKRNSYAEKERRRLDNSLWFDSPKQASVSGALQDVPNMSSSESHHWKVEGTVRPDLQDKEIGQRSSTQLRRMSEFGLESNEGQRRDYCCRTQGSLWDRANYMETVSDTPTELFRVRENQATEHNRQEYQNKPVGGPAEDSFGDCQKDFGTSGNSGRTCGEIEGMEGSQSREVCSVHRSCDEESEAIQDGDVAQKANRVGDGQNSLRRETQTSGFCRGRALDRSGWFLSFLRESAHKFSEKTKAVIRSAGTGCDVERRSCSEGQRNIAEIQHGMFQEQFGRDEAGMVGLASGHDPIADTGRLVPRRIVRVVPMGKQQMYDLEVAIPTHNFILPNGVVTSNSHAYAYAYISARLLWLKTHYPLEFYTAILMCEDKQEKIKEYKLDAKYHGIEVRPVHINKSKSNFAIADDKVYYGFSNILRFGEKAAERVEENQEYSGFPDFLERFGTDAIPVKALVSLGAFEEEHDRVILRKFADYYKKHRDARKDRQKRFEATLVRKTEELKELLLQEVKEDDPDFEAMNAFTPEAEVLWEKRFDGIMREVPYKYKGEDRIRDVTFVKLLKNLASSRQGSIELFRTKEAADEEGPTLDGFNPNLISLDPEEEKILTDEMVVDGKTTYPEAERLYYGFQWTHRLETSPDYTGRTIDTFLDEAENEGVTAGMIEVEIKNVEERESKKKVKGYLVDLEDHKGNKAQTTVTKGKFDDLAYQAKVKGIKILSRKETDIKSGVKFWTITVEDANGKIMKVNMWSDDWNRFKDDLTVGNLVKMRVRPPGGGFETLTFESIPRGPKRQVPEKEEDYRLLVMRVPPKPEPKKQEEVLDEFQFDVL